MKIRALPSIFVAVCELPKAASRRSIDGIFFRHGLKHAIEEAVQALNP